MDDRQTGEAEELTEGARMAKDERRVAIDLVNVFDRLEKGGRVVTTLAWGDAADVVEQTKTSVKLRLRTLSTTKKGASIKEVFGFVKIPSKSKLTADTIFVKSLTPGVLKVDFVDVQQGDGAVLETPEGQVVLIDGGDNQLFARYLAARFRDTSLQDPRDIACIVVTHGDADHFAGLTAIHRSETHKAANAAEQARKRLFINPSRVYHNGLVKRPGKFPNNKDRPDGQMLGKTVKDAKTKRTFVTELVDDIRVVKEMNKPFTEWSRALDAWDMRRPGKKIELLRLSRPVSGAKPAGTPFAFLAKEQIDVEVLGPLEHEIGGDPALLFLGKPIPKVDRQPGQSQVLFKGLDAGHTINGHSIVLKITYGECRFLFTGDLNEESESFLTTEHQKQRLDLEAEVFKVPHHGSADFSVDFIKAVSPVVSVISCGDESEQKEFIHPRATLVGALSKQGRASVDEPLILMTELAAFFQVEGWVFNDAAKVTHRTQKSKKQGEFFAFTRKSFGIVKVRTNGDRLLVFTFSGKEDMKEAYAFTLNAGQVTPDKVTKC
jgi:beta-lactamase superfamily II metal-dependent hydrolase